MHVVRCDRFITLKEYLLPARHALSRKNDVIRHAVSRFHQREIIRESSTVECGENRKHEQNILSSRGQLM